jgi:hypothetical protein
VVFIAALSISAYLGASIRPLFWSLPCVVASVLCVRPTKFGYALGVASGAVGGRFTGGWSLTFVFVRHGMPVPATVMHVLTAVATVGLVFFSLLGYARLPKKSWGDAALFIAAIMLVAAFLFLAIFAGRLFVVAIILVAAFLLSYVKPPGRRGLVRDGSGCPKHDDRRDG